MITVFNALSWLNKFDRSHLSLPARALCNTARRVDRSDNSVAQMLDRLENVGRISRDPLEVTEVVMHCAAVEYWHGWFGSSIRHAKEEVASYANDRHRRAVALWILGLGQWEILKNHQAYINWENARSIFQERQFFYRHVPDGNGWYTRRLRQMEIDLASKPEEILTWLNCFEGTHLTFPSQQVINTAQQRIRQRGYSDVYAWMRDLQEVNRWSREVHERSEVYLEYGLAAYEMGNHEFAIELLKKAVTDFPSGIGSNHKQVIARCMLGAIEWLDPCKHNQATIDWRTCIDEFEQLRLRADRDNDQSRKKWYADHRSILQAALSERLPNARPARRRPTATPFISPQPDAGPDAGTGSNPTNQLMESENVDLPGTDNDINEPATRAAGSESNFSDKYANLATMAHGDRALADRLIENERKQFPHESIEELIDRAIDRWIQDNR